MYSDKIKAGEKRPRKYPKRRSTLGRAFPCGHRGLGTFCHRCDNERKAQEALEARNKLAWKE